MKKRKIVLIVGTLMSIVIGLTISTFLHIMLKKLSMQEFNMLYEIATNREYLKLFLFITGIIEVLIIATCFMRDSNSFESSVVKVTNNIETPIAVGQGQHGTSRWLTDSEFKNKFKCNVLSEPQLNKEQKYNYKSGGLVIGYEKKKKKEEIYYINDNIHSLTVGATRSGKTRSVVLQTIGNLAIAGESMIISDPKAELYQYTYPFLQELGYKIIKIDFKTPLKSTRYNFLQPVIDAVAREDYRRAEEFAWDITNSLVGDDNSRMEKIWRDGEMSVICGAIISVVFDNRHQPEYQNLTNVYLFISEMCRTVNNQMPINKYIEELPPNHPAATIFSIARIAPEKTRGSFFTSALTTLKLFTSTTIYGMTCESEFNLTDAGKEKVVTYIMLPDEKTTYYPLASLFVYQNYVALVELADSRGGELSNRVNYILDEFR